MSNPHETESEQVEVSASKLQLLLATQQEEKEKHLREVSQLRAQIKARDESIKLYDDAIKHLQLSKKSKQKSGENTKRVIDEINKAKQFEEWYEKNKDKLIEEEYNKNHKAEVELLKNKLSKIIDNI